MLSTAFINAATFTKSRSSVLGTRLSCNTHNGTPVVASKRTGATSLRCTPSCKANPEENTDEIDDMSHLETIALQVTAALLGFSVYGTDAASAVPEAIKEGFKSIPASLIHPISMWIVVGVTLYTFYLGYQSSLIRKSEPEKRKKLIKSRVTERHFKTSSSLFAVVTLVTFTGMANTYSRAGKLFPGPHLYAGLGIIAVMSVMTSLVPYMQGGKDWARNSHFAAAITVTSLFLWQAKSGMVIVSKLLGWQ